MGAIMFMPQVVHHNRNASMICRPIEDGAFRCDPVVPEGPGEKFVLALIVIWGVIVLGMVGAYLLGEWRVRKHAKRFQRELERELARTVSERMPKS